MKTSHRSAEPQTALAVTELESRFEMEALPILPGGQPGTDWSCTCTFTF